MLDHTVVVALIVVNFKLLQAHVIREPLEKLILLS
jgi:hypothetical protein